MTWVWFVSLLRLARQLHSQKGCIPPALLYRCNDITSTHNMGQVIGRIETKATATYLSVLVGETMAHIAPAPRFSPLPLFSTLFLPFVYRTDHNFLAQFATATSSLEHQSNRAGLWTQQTVQNSTHTHTHTHTSMELGFKEGETTGRVIYVLRSTCLLPCGEEVKLLPAV